jgi:protein-S-isoprenylcysteine O-methyltransferase Ste14
LKQRLENIALDKLISFIKAIATIAGLITIFAPVLNVIRLSSRAKGRSSGKGAKLRTWQSVVLMAVGFIGLGVILWRPLPIAIGERLSIAFLLSGAVTYFAGIGLYLWGLFTLKSFFWVSSFVGAELYAEHKLITHGPFTLVRHPMYFGVLLTAIGGFLIYRTWAMIIFAPMSLVVIKRARHEEKLLEEEFGDKWREYAINIPRWIPCLKKYGI